MDQRSGPDRPIGEPDSDRAAADAYLPVQAFLSLYLVLIAFFILLTAMSTFQPAKTEGALQSLKTAFASAFSFGVPQDHTTQLFVEARRSYAEQVGRLLAADLPNAAIDRPQRGNLVEAAVPLASLFQPDSADLNRTADKLLHDLVPTLVRGSPEVGSLSLEFLLPGGATGEKAERLARQRASSVARRLIELGAPPEAVAVGIDGKDGDAARIIFYARPADAPRLDFKSLT